MDQLRRRIGCHTITYEELEGEYEYDFKRKEDLKKEVRQLDEEKEELRGIDLNNAKVCMDTNVENSELKQTIESLEKKLRIQNLIMMIL